MYDESEYGSETLANLKLEGAKAYTDGKNIGDNPYPFATVDYKFWDAGWWETFYAKTKFFAESLHAISENQKYCDSFTEDSKFGNAKVFDLAVERKLRSNKNAKKS
jgi:hypothetical protein